ncbi:AraC family transcriptional regulator [Paenibacillus hexagrammi]|uniref:AraC family transcriptional regulator n=1 Tax=Paenibacillus hexagrammi TaxID=2908839 RepID=A0ABY3SND6_9BACL|nr:helix-turn-helix domain-containing protein [Paenibacillus sp. YPD9-1]UJF35456.1 AraC family transcriptional regulator [Paenibacillus sp. YPD9-1]
MTTDHFYQIIQDTICYIEKHLKTNLTLDTLSASLHVSKFHLHRLIRHSTGHPLMEYIRARKLSQSIDYLLNANWKIIDIAAEFGFEHEQSYIRSFKKQFGVTPASLRKQFQQITLTEKYDVSRLERVADGIVFEPAFVVKPGCLLVGKKNQIYVQENYEHHTANAAGLEFFSQIMPHVPDKVHEHLYIGLTHMVEDPSYTYYYPSTEVHSFEQQDLSLYRNVLAPHKYIVFTYVGDFHPAHLTFRQLEQIWNYIDAWMPQAGYDFSDPYYFEYIDESLARDDYCEVGLYIPISSNVSIHS